MPCFYRPFIYPNDSFHLKIGRRMDGMEQRPFLSQRDIGIFQFLLNGPETMNHDFLSYPFRLILRFFPIITTWSNHLILIKIGLRITQQNDGKHIHIFRIKCFQSSNMYRFFLPSCLSDKADRCMRIPFLQENFLQPIELPVASFTFRIIDSRNKISRCSCLNPLFYLFPRRHQIRKRNDTEIMTDRCP